MIFYDILLIFCSVFYLKERNIDSILFRYCNKKNPASLQELLSKASLVTDNITLTVDVL
jgi:hypothetical protein